MKDNLNEYINNSNGVNPLFNKTKPEQEEAFVYTLMIYDNSSRKRKLLKR